MGAKQIFANLLIGEGDEMVVVARDQVHRVGGARYPRNVMIASKALETGHPQLVGELYEEWPETVEGKPYRSILAIPVNTESKVVGVVSIDSSLPFHFHADPNLVNYLMPYVGLLAWTLDPGYAKRTGSDEHDGRVPQ
jgi:GAF domain-containing protein